MSEEKVIEVKTEKGNTIIIPVSNVSYISEGERGINYIYLKDNNRCIETTRYIGALKDLLQKS